MTYSNEDKAKAMAIVNIFETGAPFGNYGSVAVLNDGAGISYGLFQFTHRSGSLRSVVEKYLANGGEMGRGVIGSRVPMLRTRTKAAIESLAGDTAFKKILAAAAFTGEMRAAQHAAADEMYVRPALDACDGSGFAEPLSLAVVVDSMVHGSWEKIRDRVPPAPERIWIERYIAARGEWLRGIPRLRKTSYRTTFFKQQIDAGNWSLKLPANVHGFELQSEHIQDHIRQNSSVSAARQNEPAKAPIDPSKFPQNDGAPKSTVPPSTHSPKNENALGAVEEKIDHAAAEFDRVETMITKVITRKDAAKSLWTTVAGTLWQTVWAVGTFAADVPREVWLVVAVIAAAFMLAYLYRQIALGKVRERGGQEYE